MKKLFLVAAIAIFGVATASAGVSKSINKCKVEQVRCGKGFLSGFNAGIYSAVQIGTEIILYEMMRSVYRCSVSITFRSGKVDVTMSFSGNTCSEAMAAAKKGSAGFLK